MPPVSLTSISNKNKNYCTRNNRLSVIVYIKVDVFLSEDHDQLFDRLSLWSSYTFQYWKVYKKIETKDINKEAWVRKCVEDNHAEEKAIIVVIYKIYGFH